VIREISNRTSKGNAPDEFLHHRVVRLRAVLDPSRPLRNLYEEKISSERWMADIAEHRIDGRDFSLCARP
jgi:hypothetical protein